MIMKTKFGTNGKNKPSLIKHPLKMKLSYTQIEQKLRATKVLEFKNGKFFECLFPYLNGSKLIAF